ncbi:MAG: EAL and HDOD domain-containing protein [Pirellulaceae bacterium]
MPASVPLFARQPIFDRENAVQAYELLFRHNDENRAVVIDGDQATSTVLLHSFGEYQFEEFIGDCKAYVNYTRNLLLNPPPLLPKHKVVVEILEDIEPDAEVLRGIARMRDEGHLIALDDYVLTKNTAQFLEFASIVKIDVLQLGEAEVRDLVDELKPHNLTLLAEKVENHEVMEMCIDLGFDLFQGYYLCKPKIVRGVKITENKQSVLRLISALNNPDIQVQKVVEIIGLDPTLSYKILRLVNSSAVGLARKIDSLSQAVALLGLQAIKSWVTFLLMANNDDKPQELGVLSLCRAKFCELIGKEIGGRVLGEACFTTGLLSSLDAFLDTPLDEIVSTLNLTESMNDALLNGGGEAGMVLQIVENYQRGNWDAIDWSKVEKFGVDPQAINRLYGESVVWATQLIAE